jgi:hypothetical protein
MYADHMKANRAKMEKDYNVHIEEDLVEEGRTSGYVIEESQ